MEMIVAPEAHTIYRLKVRVLSFPQALHKMRKRRLSIASDNEINKCMLQEMLRKERGMRAAHYSDDILINLLGDPRCLQRLNGIGRVRSRNTDDRRRLLLNDLPDLIRRCPEAIKSAKERKGGIHVIPIEGSQVLKRFRHGEGAFPACSEINYGYIAKVPDLRGNVEEI